MDTPPPADLDERDLSALLVADWGLHPISVRYQPKGAGSYHWAVETGERQALFVTVDDLDSKPWIGHERHAVFDGLRTAYEAAWSLRHRVALDVVVAPLKARGGSVLARLADRYGLSVLPFVSGVAGTWGQPVSPAVRESLLVDLARIHQATEVEPRLARRALDVPERTALEDALFDLDAPWDAGPFGEPARRALSVHAGDVSGWLTELDVLARVLERRAQDVVVTHGEPHPGNLIQTESGLRLVDWDTVALALPERDLWMLDDRSADPFASYRRVTGRAVDRTAISFYRLAWTLSDIASLTQVFRVSHEPTRWAELKLTGLVGLLRGARSDPFGQAVDGAVDPLRT